MTFSSTTSEPLAKSILDFWFGELTPLGGSSAEFQERWFKKDPAFDELIKKKFAEYTHLAFMGAFDRWTLVPASTVALIVLLDQFPRNIFRGSARAFAFDKKALAVSWQAVDAKIHLQVPTAAAYFVVMPLMHSEFLNVQDRCLEAFKAIQDHAPAEQKGLISNALDFAARHRAIIARFQRFPHRNALLERISTPEEAAFLKEPGSSF